MKQKKPTLYSTEVEREIANRTKVPITMVADVLRVYADIVEECAICGVDIGLSNIGYFTRKYVPPVEDRVYFNPVKMEYGEPQYIPGHYKPIFRFGSTCKKRIKIATSESKEESIENERKNGLE